MKLFNSKKIKMIAILLIVAIMGGVVYNTGVTKKSKADEIEKISYEEALDKCVEYNEEGKCYEVVNEELMLDTDKKMLEEQVNYVNTYKKPQEIQRMIDKQRQTQTKLEGVYGEVKVHWYGFSQKMSYWDLYSYNIALKQLREYTEDAISVILPFTGLAQPVVGVVVGCIAAVMNINRKGLLNDVQKCLDKKVGGTLKYYWTGLYEVVPGKK